MQYKHLTKYIFKQYVFASILDFILYFALIL